MDDVKVGNFKSILFDSVGFYLEVLFYLGIFFFGMFFEVAGWFLWVP